MSPFQWLPLNGFRDAQDSPNEDQALPLQALRAPQRFVLGQPLLAKTNFLVAFLTAIDVVLRVERHGILISILRCLVGSNSNANSFLDGNHIPARKTSRAESNYNLLLQVRREYKSTTVGDELWDATIPLLDSCSHGLRLEILVLDLRYDPLPHSVSQLDHRT